MAGGGIECCHPVSLRKVLHDYLGGASLDNEAAIGVFSGCLGCVLESTQTDLEVHLAVESFTSDKYEVIYHNRPPEPVGGLRLAFITIGDGELEFLQEFDPRAGTRVDHDRAGTTRQDQGAITRFIATRGPGLHHLALKAADINGALDALGRAGHALIDRTGRSCSWSGRLTPRGQTRQPPARVRPGAGPGDRRRRAFILPSSK